MVLFGKKEKHRGITHLPIGSTIYVPTTKLDKKISSKEQKRRVDETRKYLSKKFGGYTSVKSVGGYLLKNKKLVKEKIHKVTSFADKKGFNKNKPKVINKLRNWGRKWKQESMAFEHEGDLYLIASSRKRKK